MIVPDKRYIGKGRCASVPFGRCVSAVSEASEGMRDPKTFVPRPFRPAWWLPGPHAQTVAGRYLRPRGGVRYRRERVELPDGDFLDLDFATVEGRPVPDAAETPAVLVVHGLEGSAQSAYVLETCRALAGHGIRAVAMNFRSCGGEPNRLARLYHAGDTGDVAFALDLLAERFPGAPLGAVGFSLGGNQLLKHLGERGREAGVRAAVGVSVPFDLDAGASKLEASAMGRLYASVFVRSLRGKFLAKRDLIGDTCDEARVLRARSLREFDEAATAPLHGFRDAAHYYAVSSSGPFLPRIRVPTLLVHAADDPFVPAEAMPHAAVRENPCLAAAFTEQGGHVGFIGGPPRARTFWAEAEAARFLAGYLGSA